MRTVTLEEESECFLVKKSGSSLRSFKKLCSQRTFSKRHTRGAGSFTRRRKLPFQSVLELLLRKSVKSLQLLLNEWSDRLDYRVSASALSQARQKISHTAFIELHEECVLRVMYADGDYRKYRGHRLLALDGTSLRLPRTEGLIETFGLIRHMNGNKQSVHDQVESKVALLYDVLNEVVLSGTLNPGRTNDMKACRQELECLNEQDIVLADRGYVSYGFFAEILAKNANFIVRCKSRDFLKVIDYMTSQMFVSGLSRFEHRKSTLMNSASYQRK